MFLQPLWQMNDFQRPSPSYSLAQYSQRPLRIHLPFDARLIHLNTSFPHHNKSLVSGSARPPYPQFRTIPKMRIDGHHPSNSNPNAKSPSPSTTTPPGHKITHNSATKKVPPPPPPGHKSKPAILKEGTCKG